MVTKVEAAAELLRRREARRTLGAYIQFTNPKFKKSWFSDSVCNALDNFIEDALAGNRPILVLQAPPQHGKSEIVSRKLPAFLLAKYPNLRVGAASYSDELANAMAQDVRRNIDLDEHRCLFPVAVEKRRYDINRAGEFTAQGGTGGYIGVGVGAGLTGRAVDVGIIDDPIKNQQEALSATTKESHWNWYQTVFTTRLSEKSGQIIMATSWAEDDLSSKICKQFASDPRLKILRFPAVNEPGEVGYNPALPRGPLVPELKSLQFLLEVKGLFSDYWWAAMYQQCPRALGGNVFKESGIRYYIHSDLPKKFDKIIQSWDLTFKNTDGSDFVVGQVWGKVGANSYLLDQCRARMSFTQTVRAVVAMREKWGATREILIEDKANGPAVIDTLKASVAGIIPIEPDGSKLARAHAVTSYWEAGNVWLPHDDIAAWVKDLVAELTAFPASANDDQVDALTQALRQLYPLFNKLKIKQEAINKAFGR